MAAVWKHQILPVFSFPSPDWKLTSRQGVALIKVEVTALAPQKKPTNICPQISLEVTDILGTVCRQQSSLKNICSGEHQF